MSEIKLNYFDADKLKKKNIVYEILKDFKCLDPIRDYIENNYQIKQNIPKITTILQEKENFIFYGAPDNSHLTKLSNTADHTMFLKLYNPNIDTIRSKDLTICLCMKCNLIHSIYIKNLNTNNIYIIGSKCKDKFIRPELSGKRCTICFEPHNRRKGQVICKKCEKEEKKRLKEKEKKEKDEELKRIKELELLKKIDEDNYKKFVFKNSMWFGKYRFCRYEEVFKDINYMNWIIKTYNESEDKKNHNFRYLVRLYNSSWII